MIETTVGNLSSKKLERPTSYTGGYRHFEETEELESEFGSEDEMGELSDSPSSAHTTSCPVTPSHPPTAIVHIPSHSSRSRRPSSSSPHGVNGGDEVFKLADKAVQILGLTPGSLAHARACLENARDEVRRTADSPEPVSTMPEAQEGQSHLDMSGGASRGGMRERMQTRARKAMSATFTGGGHVKMGSMGVVLGAGGKEEEERRERRRRAADGVLYWQREVARLVDSEPLEAKPSKGRR
ncbi:hypothetical protein IAT38_007714 [Cryptococcus sp. DSM 104549]